MRIQLDHAYTTEEIAKITGAVCYGSHVFRALVTDSREAQKGDLFIALHGEKDDGRFYIKNALKNGADAVLCEEAATPFTRYILHVPDVMQALAAMASAARRRINPTVIAITGSVGKTTLKNTVAATLSMRFRVHKTEKNYNNLLGVCLTLLSMPLDTEFLVCELGMNHSGEIRELSRIVAPDIAVITNIGTAHIGNLGSRQNIARAKLEILEGCVDGALFLYPINEEFLAIPLQKDLKRMPIGASREAYCHYENCCVSHGKMTADYHCAATSYPKMQICGIGNHLAEAVCFAICIAHTFGMREEEIRVGLQKTGTEKMRQRIFRLGDYTIIEDCYNASPESVRAALTALTNVAHETGGRKLALLGDMLELGTETRILHESVGVSCAEANIDLLYTFGAAAESIAIGAARRGTPRENIRQNPNPSAPEVSAAQIYADLKENDVLLIKASRALAAERIIACLEEYTAKGTTEK